ncbi:hypothetical protein ACQJBY_008957 [Aegilops geniculata]
MEPTRSPLVLLVAQAVLAAAMLQQPSEARVQAVAPSARHLAGGKEAEAAAATSSPASPFTGDPPLVLLVAYAVLAEAMLEASETRAQAATSSPSSPFTAGDPPQPSLPGSPPLPGSPSFPPSPGFPGMAGAQPSTSPSLHPARTCMEPLILVEPCASYLTNSSVRAPPRTCCDGLRSLVGGGDRICLCHAIMGDLGTFAGGTIDQHVHTAGASSDVHRQV